MEAEEQPEGEDVQDEEREGAGDDRALSRAAGHGGVGGDEEQENEGHRDVHVDEAVGVELRQEEAVANGAGEHEGGHHGGHEQEGEQNARPLAGPQVDDAPQATGKGHARRLSELFTLVRAAVSSR